MLCLPANGFLATTCRNSEAVRRMTSGRKPNLRWMASWMRRERLTRFFFIGEEDHISALHVGLRGFAFGGFVEGAKGVHFDFLVAADVDAAQHGNDDGHGGSEYIAGRGMPKFENSKIKFGKNRGRAMSRSEECIVNVSGDRRQREERQKESTTAVGSARLYSKGRPRGMATAAQERVK